MGTDSGFLSRWSEQLTGKFKPEAGGRILQTARNPYVWGHSERAVAGAKKWRGQEPGQSPWVEVTSQWSRARADDCQKARLMSQPENDPGHDLAGEERTEGTVKNQQVGQPTGRGHRLTAGGTADGGEIWTWTGGQGTI